MLPRLLPRDPMDITFLLAGVPVAFAAGFLVQHRRIKDLSQRLAPIRDAELSAKGIRGKAEAFARSTSAQADEVLSRARASGAQLFADASTAITTLQAEASSARAVLQSELAELAAQRQSLAVEYTSARSTFERLTAETQLLEENLQDISFGVYKPHFTYQTSEAYKQALERLYHREKELIRSGLAASCNQQWQVGGSVKEGERMTKQYVKLLIRAFNAECDACIARVAWNNIRIMEERIRKAFSALNQLGSVMQMALSQDFQELKLAELRLTHEQEEKKQEEKEETRRARERIREEEKVQRELAKAADEAEAAETSAERELAKTRKAADRAEDETQRVQFAARILELEGQLAQAHAQRERAISQAQLTRCGHVYVLSNMGAFGEGIVKIGMTRRLEPMERVAELGDASVPFPFDLHALIYTEDAPELETALHTHFWDHRINLANDRKEFFRVELKEVENFIVERGLNATITHLHEAKEYRQTMANRDAVRQAQSSTPTPVVYYPEALFPDGTGQRPSLPPVIQL